ncbi:MAG TPA: TlyA family rRNA (cytidine-2'-O)-methyltransferase [Ruminococcaceae bacterium]|nr:TlyA family rRNA (cytidine-2'-O)-methyltransferase [Oscillospiraceae bacterium]
MSKTRADLLLIEQGLEKSRERAKALIMEGIVYANDIKVDKPGETLDSMVHLEIRGHKLPYVSRGGLKLEKAMQVFPISLKDKTCMDVGASTGGFTDCMLQNGAKRVYSIDVGYGQLAWSLRTNPQVVSLERTNIRKLKSEQVPEPIDFFSVDISFISLKLALPVIRNYLKDSAEGVCLIKPQFEAGREKVGKHGVVRDEQTHREVIRMILDFLPTARFSAVGLDFSPVKGPEGNIEYLLYLKATEPLAFPIISEANVVQAAHQALDKHSENK